MSREVTLRNVPERNHMYKVCCEINFTKSSTLSGVLLGKRLYSMGHCATIEKLSSFQYTVSLYNFSSPQYIRAIISSFSKDVLTKLSRESRRKEFTLGTVETLCMPRRWFPPNTFTISSIVFFYEAVDSSNNRNWCNNILK